MFAERPAFGTLAGADYAWLSYSEFGARVEAAKGALMTQLGVQKGETVAVISRNRTEWAVAAYAPPARVFVSVADGVAQVRHVRGRRRVCAHVREPAQRRVEVRYQ